MSVAVSTKQSNTATVATVVGEVDVSNAPVLRDALDDALASCESKSMDIDVSEVPYIDSTGIGVLVGIAHRAADAGITLRVLNPQRNVARVLSMLGVDGELGVTA